MQARMKAINNRINIGLISGLIISPIRLMLFAIIAIRPIIKRAKKIIHIIKFPFLEFEPKAYH